MWQILTLVNFWKTWKHGCLMYYSLHFFYVLKFSHKIEISYKTIENYVILGGYTTKLIFKNEYFFLTLSRLSQRMITYFYLLKSLGTNLYLLHPYTPWFYILILQHSPFLFIEKTTKQSILIKALLSCVVNVFLWIFSWQ